ncbi:ABC transporter permease [Citrifermentans bremense]|uniref:ABC transporter permease n=1 Tax=Citrifermentans bremense TaxID=60035 RepID=UPI000422EE95|nr:ABC transporter permease [Citrifermentans bremense]
MIDEPKRACAARWDKVISARNGWFDLRPAEIWKYRDLIALFVWRDFVAIYKQTILGPLWFLLQPLMTTFVFTVIFGKVARIPTDGAPPFLFYLSGLICWKYFADCLVSTSNTFVGNAHVFGKVYFPRLTVPISVVISNLVAFGIQFLLFLAVLVYYRSGHLWAEPQGMVLLPLLVLQMAALGLGCGIVVSSMTIRYRDLSHLVGFGMQLWMFATPVVYPASAFPEKWRWLLLLNPMAPLIEVFRHAFLGTGSFDLHSWLASLVLTVAVLLAGVVLFNRVEKSFMDTV